MKIVIYGAGVYGKKCFYFLASVGSSADYFCQTHVGEQRIVLGIPVIGAEELPRLGDDVLIFLAISDRDASNQIRKTLMQDSGRIINIYDFCDLQPEDDLLYSGRDFEVKIMYRYWLEYFREPERLQRSTEALCRGLSAEDKQTVCRIIDRMKQFVDGDSWNLDIFTISEKRRIREMEADLKQNSGRGVTRGRNFYFYRDYKLYQNSFEPSVFYYRLGLDHVHDLERVKRENIIDVGAYIGDSAVVLSEYTSQKVYAFEAFYDNYKEIGETAALNGRTNIVPVPMALGEDRSTKTFYLRADSDTGHGMMEREGLAYRGRIDVDQITLDEYVEENGLRIGLIKVDIEGGERNFLRGAGRTICSQRPVLLISMYHTADDFFELKQLIEQLDAGYSFRIFHPVTRAKFLLETALVCEAEQPAREAWDSGCMQEYST